MRVQYQDYYATPAFRTGRTFQGRCTCAWMGPVRPYDQHGKCDADASAHLATSRDPNCYAWIATYDEADDEAANSQEPS